MRDWKGVSEEMMSREDFGLAYMADNGWLSEELKKLTTGVTDQKEKAKKIFEFVRDNFSCTDTYGISLRSNTSLKDIFKRKNGTVSELNLLLVAMLRHASFDTDPFC